MYRRRPGCLGMPEDTKEQIGKRRKALPGTLRGSYTVETVLLMMIILPALIAIWIAGLWIHDRTRLQGIACEAAAAGSAAAALGEEWAGAQQIAQELAETGLFWARGAAVSTMAGEDASGAVCSASFRLPGLTAPFLGQGVISLNGSWDRTVYHPARLIRKVRGIRYVSGLL